MIRQVDHINIVVADLARSLYFYGELLGFEPYQRAHLEGDWIEEIVGLAGVSAEVVYLQPPGGGPRLELICYETPSGQDLPANAHANTVGLRHLAFRVDDIQADYERLLAAGVKFIGPPTAVPAAAVTHKAGSKRLCYCHDPDGVLVELAEYR